MHAEPRHDTLQGGRRLFSRGRGWSGKVGRVTNTPQGHGTPPAGAPGTPSPVFRPNGYDWFPVNCTKTQQIKFETVKEIISLNLFPG